MLKRCALVLALLAVSAPVSVLGTGAQPVRAKQGMVASQNFMASQVGIEVLWAGGNAVDAAVATAFTLAVTHPTAGNIGGGGFLLYRPASGDPVAYDFRETAPAGSSPTMFLTAGVYDKKKHHDSHLSVGVPGTVAGLHMAWRAHGKLPWRRLLDPAIAMAREGIVVTPGLSRSLREILPEMKPYPASIAQFTRKGVPYEAGDLLQQTDLAEALERIADRGPAGFYEGKTAELIEAEMKRGGGLITRADLKAYRPKSRVPLRGTYRGYDVLAMPPISSGGTALLQMLNVLEGYDLRAQGFRLRRHRPPHGGVDAAGLRRSRAVSRRSGVQPGPAHRAPDLEGLRAFAEGHDRREEGLDLVAVTLRVAGGEPRDDPPLRDRRRPQRGGADLHPRGRLRIQDRRPRRRLPPQQRDGRLQRRTGPHHRRGPHRHRTRTSPPPASACSRA